MAYSTNIYFNSFNLGTLSNVYVFNHRLINMPSRNLNRVKLARADKSILTSAEYVEKEVRVNGVVTGDTKTNIETAFETLKGILQTPERPLRVEQAGDNVEYTATLNGISEEFFGKNLKFELSFICSNPIGASVSTSTLLDTTATSATKTSSITVGGSYKALPLIKVTIDSITGGTAKTIQVLNSNTNQGISVTRDWTANEILTVDSFNKIVEVDDAEVDYNGVFPNFFPGNRSFQYIDDFTTRSVDILLTYNKQYA